MSDRIRDTVDMLAALLPEGPVWSAFRTPGTVAYSLLAAKAAGYARIEDRAIDLLVDVNPASALETLAAWEEEAGLPGPCALSDATIEERRLALVNQWRARGGQSIAYFAEVAETLGYEIGVTEHRPFRCGFSPCGADHEVGDPVMRHHWHVAVPGPRINYFRCGQSQVGRDPLGFVRRAEDLECLLKRRQPAHTNLHFRYEGI